MMLTMIGTNAPVATRPEILCSMVSMASSGFLAAVGSATPAVSLMKQRMRTKNAGTQNTGLANHGSFDFCSSVVALQYWQQPTALTPSSGEMATLVIIESVCAIPTPGGGAV